MTLRSRPVGACHRFFQMDARLLCKGVATHGATKILRYGADFVDFPRDYPG
jgi:hypothetical protein